MNGHPSLVKMLEYPFRIDAFLRVVLVNVPDLCRVAVKLGMG